MFYGSLNRNMKTYFTIIIIRKIEIFTTISVISYNLAA